MSATTLTTTPARYDSPEAAELVAELQAEYVQRYGDGDTTPVTPQDFEPPDGLFLLVHLGDEIIGSMALRRHVDDATDSTDASDATGATDATGASDACRASATTSGSGVSQSGAAGGAGASGGARRTPAGDVVEFKRLYVRAAHRRRGHARRVLRLAEERAAAMGYRRVVLETGTEQPEAMALYTSEGYHPIPTYGHYACAPLSRCFGKLLSPGPETEVS